MTAQPSVVPVAPPAPPAALAAHASTGANAEASSLASWTCPFCPLLCDDLQPQVPAGGHGWQLAGGDCARARTGLDALAGLSGLAVAPAPEAAPAGLLPLVNGQPVALDQALDAAAALLRGARQPLFGGLATDVAGARALYGLACATGAISDAAQGPAMMAALRALQDRGGYTTTLAELRSRADLVLCLGGLPTAAAPRFFERPEGVAPHTVLQLGGDVPPAGHAPPVEHIAPGADPFHTLAALAAVLAGHALPKPDPNLAALAARLQAATYAVVVAEPGRWQANAGLVVEGVNRIVSLLNARGRAAALWLGGGEGAATVNQVFGWLSGLPLRSRASPAGLAHEPLAWDAQRLLADGAVDAVLWVASFSSTLAPNLRPPASGLPMVVLGDATLALPPRPAPTVFIPVGTPGVHHAGHLIRTDGTVLLPLWPVPTPPPSGLPSVAQVVAQLSQRLERTHG